MEAREAGRSVTPGDRAQAIFRRILVGIDETAESLVAAAQAGVLREPDGRIMLLAVAERHLAAHAGGAAAHAEDRLVAGTEADLERARELVDADDAVLSAGRLVDRLYSEGSRHDATLIAIGARPHRLFAALTFGGPDIDALHDASCSVLIARRGWGPTRPDRILVALDGSPESRAAEAVGRALARRIERDVVPVIGLGDDIEHAILREERDDALLDPGRLVDAVADAATRATLVVVGRGRDRGRRWGGTQVERIVYGADCSVLVVQHDPDAAE